tara:strand:+ start:3594 stop:4922 length:1329 start_codon:yes stop_codon:yes gene_type:complete
MNKDIVIEISNLSKKYKLGSISSKTFVDDIKSFFFKFMGKENSINKTTSRNILNRKMTSGEIYALDNINLKVEKGEILGIIGKNGAGKSTLLKILSRITSPSSGNVKLRGRISSLLEVGTGFHPDLTGRENIFLNGAILGMTSNEIKSKIDEIIDFSGIESFIDTPVKRYSSGMRVRLGFSVAAYLDSEILIIDEVLAVGDAAFQKKCIGKMNSIAKDNRTVLFVSHSMTSVKNLCSKGIIIENGSITFQGNIHDVVQKYLATTHKTSFNGEFKKENPLVFKHLLEFEKVILRNSKGAITNTFNFMEDIEIEIYYEALEKIDHPNFWVELDCELGRVMKANMLIDGLSPHYIEGKGSIKLYLKNLKLSEQLFTINIGLRDSKNEVIASTIITAAGFYVKNNFKKMNIKSPYATKFIKASPILIPYVWEYDNKKLYPPYENNN